MRWYWQRKIVKMRFRFRIFHIFLELIREWTNSYLFPNKLRIYFFILNFPISTIIQWLQYNFQGWWLLLSFFEIERKLCQPINIYHINCVFSVEFSLLQDISIIDSILFWHEFISVASICSALLILFARFLALALFSETE